MSAPALTPAMARAFSLVGEAGGTFRVPRGPDAGAVNDALCRLEGVGLVCRVGPAERRTWAFTPNGATRWADMLAAQTGRRA